MVSTYEDVKEVIGKAPCSRNRASRRWSWSALRFRSKARRNFSKILSEQRRRVPRRTGERKRESHQGREADLRRVRAEGSVREGQALSRHDGHRLQLRRRRRARAHRQDLPQRAPRRGHPVAVRDHGPRGEGRHAAPCVSRLPEQERDGLDVHALQDAGAGEPRLPRHLHAASCCARTSTSASTPGANSRCRCRSPRSRGICCSR